MISSIIIDDEVHCTDHLSGLLKAEHEESIMLKAVCHNLTDGISAVSKIQPDLIFLDVQLGNQSGFDLLKALEQIKFEVIFTTAFDRYAVQAFRFSAMDYLLKPIDGADLQRSLNKFNEKKELSRHLEKLEVLFHNLQGQSQRITISSAEGLVFVPVSDIIRCEAEINYTNLYLKGNKKIKASKTLKEFQTLLTTYNFFRVHHAHLINLAYIKSYRKGNGGFAVMSDDSIVEVSTRRKEDLLKRLTKS